MNDRTTYNYEIVQYSANLPFRMNIKKEREEILEHWHDELEVVYTLAGHSLHYIDGRAHIAGRGSLLVTNSQSIHRIQTDDCAKGENGIYAIVLMIKYSFVESIVENMKEKYFLTEVQTDSERVHEIMMGFLQSAGRFPGDANERLKMMGLLYELMYYLCRDALVEKESILPINSQKNLERLRALMVFVQDHYREKIRQQDVAKRFYFTKEYFARFFRKNTGMSFMEYLTRYRVEKAAIEIVETDRSILDIALENGFADARGLIRAFHSVFGQTPLQYRKEYRKEGGAKLGNFSDYFCKDDVN